MRNIRLLGIIAAAALTALPAAAQVRQSGNVTPGHATSWATTGVVQDAGTSANGAITTLGITNTGTPFCINDALISSPTGYHQFCLAANSLGGGLISYNAYGGASTLPLQINLNGVTSTIGQGTVNTALLGNIAWYAANGTVISGNANANISNGALTLGQTASVIGKVSLAGNSSGTVTIAPQAAAGTFNFNLPITAGTSGQVLTSGGGGSSPMTWTSFGGSVNSGSAGQFTYYATTGTAVSGSTLLSQSGSVVSVTGDLSFTPSNQTATFSPTGTGSFVANPATLGTIDNITIGGTTKAAGSFTTLLATGQISSGVAASSLGSLALSGNSGGTVIIKPQASAGSYNFNIPTTAGSSGQPLLSGGGGASAMTYGSLSGNTSTFATTTGSLTSGHAAVFDASGNIADGGALPTGTINSGTATQLAYYAGSGTTISGNGNATISSGALTLGVTGATAGSEILSGSSTGAITLKGSGTTIGTYNWNFPTTAGSSGNILASGGGSAAAMTWDTVSGNTTVLGTVTGALTNGHCIAADASGNLIDNGSTCGTGGSGTVTSSTAGQIAYYPSSTNAVAGNSSVTVSGGAVTFGVPTTTQGQLKLSGATTGTITVTGQAAAGTYEFDLPTTAGTSGQFLRSAGGAGSPMTWASAGLGSITSQTTSFSAASNTSYCVDTGGGAVTATLPGSPSNNDTIQFVTCSNYSVNNLILSRNGNNIQGLAENMNVSTNNASFSVVFVTSYGWRIF